MAVATSCYTSSLMKGIEIRPGGGHDSALNASASSEDALLSYGGGGRLSYGYSTAAVKQLFSGPAVWLVGGAEG